jgi:hypothetical protein
MKYLVLIIALVGCNLQPTIHKGQSPQSVIGGGNIRHFEYEGHQYIYFSGYRRAAMAHDPDCPCHSPFSPKE